MSGATQTTASGTKDATPTPKRSVTQAAKDFAMTMALQKTEWQNMEGIKPLLFTLKDGKSGRKAAGVIFVCLTDNIEADEDSFTFLVSGANIDDIVADIATENKILENETANSTKG